MSSSVKSYEEYRGLVASLPQFKRAREAQQAYYKVFADNFNAQNGAIGSFGQYIANWQSQGSTLYNGFPPPAGPVAQPGPAAQVAQPGPAAQVAQPGPAAQQNLPNYNVPAGSLDTDPLFSSLPFLASNKFSASNKNASPSLSTSQSKPVNPMDAVDWDEVNRKAQAEARVLYVLSSDEKKFGNLAVNKTDKSWFFYSPDGSKSAELTKKNRSAPMMSFLKGHDFDGWKKYGQKAPKMKEFIAVFINRLYDLGGGNAAHNPTYEFVRDNIPEGKPFYGDVSEEGHGLKGRGISRAAIQNAEIAAGNDTLARLRRVDQSIRNYRHLRFEAGKQ